MAVPWNLVHALPNMNNLPRSTICSFIGQDVGFLYSMVGGGGSTGFGNTSSVGFDLQVKNKSGVKITIAIDGAAVPILDGELQSISTIPYDKIQITDTTGAVTANAVDIFCMGLPIVPDIVSYTQKQPEFNLWG